MCIRDSQYGAVCSRDHGKTWADVSDRVSFPKGTRQGTAFTVEKAVLDQFLRIHHFNPLIPDNIADPSLSKFGDTYYLYGTTDIDKGLSLIHISEGHTISIPATRERISGYTSIFSLAISVVPWLRWRFTLLFR